MRRWVRVPKSNQTGIWRGNRLDHCPQSVGCDGSNGTDQWLLSAPNSCHAWSYVIEFPICFVESSYRSIVDSMQGGDARFVINHTLMPQFVKKAAPFCQQRLLASDDVVPHVVCTGVRPA